jgi:hypothetical protein
MKQLKQITPLEATGVSGGEGDCGSTVTVGTDGINVNTSTDNAGTALINTYEGIIQATSYAIERVINAVSE